MPDAALNQLGATAAAPTMAEPFTNCLRSMTSIYEANLTADFIQMNFGLGAVAFGARLEMKKPVSSISFPLSVERPYFEPNSD